MNPKSVFCEECLEEIPNDECYWDEKRLFCGRCGSELELGAAAPDVFEEITTEKATRLLRLEDEESDDEESDDEESEKEEPEEGEGGGEQEEEAEADTDEDPKGSRHP